MRPALDAWSFVHAGTGVLAGLMGMRPATFAILAIAFEAVENSVDRQTTGEAENVPNIIADLGLNAVGFVAGRSLRETLL